MTQLVLFNGPPGCGKDTVVSNLVPYITFTHLKFAAAIKRAAAGMLQMTLSDLEKLKDTPQRALARPVDTQGYGDGVVLDTPRKFLIALSEDLMKPRYGNDVSGNMLWQEAKNVSTKLVLVSDCGFDSEVSRVVRGAGASQCLTIRIHRDGHDFVGDSRSYLSDTHCKTVDIYNNRTPHWLTMQALRVIMTTFPNTQTLKEPEWLRDTITSKLPALK